MLQYISRYKTIVMMYEANIQGKKEKYRLEADVDYVEVCSNSIYISATSMIKRNQLVKFAAKKLFT